ncbi:phosphoribosyl-AMP cyclohydrolase [bacterium]|nr:phosphoribosyl-AMP cyclohydrolase [bacterium]
MEDKKSLHVNGDLLNQVKWNGQGLLPGIVQDRETREVLMVAWLNPESLQKTLESGNATFWSRSRRKLWMKGETSGNLMKVESVLLDCDGDTIVLLCRASGPACHTGERTCFYRVLADSGIRETSGCEGCPGCG